MSASSPPIPLLLANGESTLTLWVELGTASTTKRMSTLMLVYLATVGGQLINNQRLFKCPCPAEDRKGLTNSRANFACGLRPVVCIVID